MEQKVLYDERKDLAMQSIYDHQRDARLMTELITFYNALPVVAPIEKAEQAKEFLTAPVNYFDAAIIRDTGIRFDTAAKPCPRAISQMFQIPYQAFVDKVAVNRVRMTNLAHYTFDEATRKIEMSPTAADEIKESYKLYIRPGQEQDEYNKIQKLADEINELAPRYKMDGTEINRIPSAIRFFTAIPKSPGPGWMLAPNFEAIKKYLGTPNK